jgi:hypothetical protein
MMMKLAEFAICAISLACSGTPQSEGGTPEQNLTTASEEGAGTMRQALTLAIDEAFVWVPAGTPAPLPQWSYNSENGSNSVTIIGTGRYRVDFGNLYSVQGNAQVSAYGDTNARCKVRSWGATSTSGGVSLNVDCYAPSGTPTNSSFVASFVGGHATATYAHLWTESIDRDHTAPAAYSRNSAGQTNFVDRTGTGQYSVVLNGLNTSNGNVQVTAYGSTPTHCNVYYWTRVADDTVAHVRCFDTSGALADSLFTLRYMTTQAGYPGRSDLAYAWANDFISASYQPHATYQFNSLSGQPAISARRTATGKYSLTFPGMPLAETTAMVTAYGGASVHCHPKGWAGSDTSATGPGITTTLEINCYAANGNPADSQFTAAFVHAQPTTHGFVSTTTNTTTNRCVTGTVSDQLDNLDSFAHTKVSYDAREETVLPPTGDNIPFPDNDFVNDHVQGIGRLYGPSAKNWMVMTISDESQGGMFFVELGEVDGRAGEAFQAGDRNNTSLNRNRAYYPLDSKHPGGLQVLGTSIVATVGSSLRARGRRRALTNGCVLAPPHAPCDVI